jgi:hypothetical protein
MNGNVAASTALFPHELFRVRAIGETGDPYWLAGTVEDGSILPEPGEKPLWSGFVTTFELPTGSQLDGAWIVITDRRLAFSSNDFDRADTYLGMGGLGAAVSVVANARSKKRAAQRREGKILVGHLRHEWITGVTLDRVKWIGGPTTILGLAVRMSAGTALVQFRAKPALPFEFASWLAQLVAHHRLDLGLDIADDAQDLVRRAAEGTQVDYVDTVPQHFVWNLPGSSESHVLACQAQLARTGQRT